MKPDDVVRGLNFIILSGVLNEPSVEVLRAALALLRAPEVAEVEAARKEAQEALGVAAAMKRLTGQDNPYVQVWETMLAGLDALARAPGLVQSLAHAEALVMSHEGHIAGLEAERAAVARWLSLPPSVDQQALLERVSRAAVALERVAVQERELGERNDSVEHLTAWVADLLEENDALEDKLARVRAVVEPFGEDEDLGEEAAQLLEGIHQVLEEG